MYDDDPKAAKFVCTLPRNTEVIVTVNITKSQYFKVRIEFLKFLETNSLGLQTSV